MGLFHLLPHNNILDLPKCRVLENYKLNVVQMVGNVFDKVENIVRKGGKAFENIVE